jgi:hypothetical protein
VSIFLSIFERKTNTKVYLTPLHGVSTDPLRSNIRLMPRIVPVGEITARIYRSLQSVLQAWGVPSHRDLTDVDVARSIGAKFVVEDVLVEATFGGFRGVEASHILLEAAPPPALPPYVYAMRESMPQPAKNRTKAYLAKWVPPIVDTDDYVTLYTGSRDPVASTGAYDYWTTKAVVQSASRIQQDVLDGKLDLQSLARRLDHVLVVVTSDEKLLLACRGNLGVVDNMAGSWMTSVGESIDGDTDRDAAGVPSPMRAVARCLMEHDELNLAESDLAGARVTYLGLATEWAYMYVNLIVLVELRVVADRVLDRALPGEHKDFAVIDFTPEACLDLIRRGTFKSKRFPEPNPIVPASRVALLLSLFSRFGRDEIVSRIEALI